MAGRKKLPAAEKHGPEFVGKTPPDLAAAEVLARASGDLPTRDQAESWVVIGKLVGRMESALVAATVSDRIIAESYRSIVESKAYIGIPYKTAEGNGETVSSLDEFCSVFLGKSARRCQQIASNYQLLGEELYSSAERIGLGQRDYNALKALPADDQEVIRQALAQGADKAGVVGMLTDLANRQAAEIAEARADLQAKNERIAKLGTDLEKEHEKLSKAQRKWKAATPNDRQVMLEQRVVAAEETIRAMLNPAKDSLRAAVLELAQHCDENELDCAEFLGDVFGRLLNAVRTVRDDETLPFAIPVVSDGDE
jgi:pyrimidine operon attenuation protein/uracil phosphoribosyltransferase